MTAVFRAEEEPVASRAAYWRHVGVETIVPLDLHVLGGADFSARIVAGQVGPVGVTEVVGPAAELTRTEMLIRRSDPDLVKIDVQVEGSMLVEQRDRQALLGPGDLAFADLSCPGRWVNSVQRCVVAMFPRAALPFTPDEVTQLTGLRIGGGEDVAGLVASLARQLPRHLETGAVADGARLGTALLDLLAVTLAARLDRRSAVPPNSRQRALLASIHAFMEEQLADPRLSPAMIAAANHVSVRYLHKLFEAEGTTVTSWIRRCRLERCSRDLLEPARSTQPVSTIGIRWGFSSAEQFSRTFKAAYGVPPGEYRRMVRRSERG
jgi:AraC-like DNA-binding protein